MILGLMPTRLQRPLCCETAHNEGRRNAVVSAGYQTLTSGP